jgi:dihydrofolate reductase
MTLSILVAASENRIIGIDGQLPWHLPNDLKLFKNLTWAKPVIMGRNTYDSLGKPLKGRVNIVVTSQNGWTAEGVQVAHGLDEALEMAKATQCQEAFIIGGGKIYQQMLPMADRVYITKVHAHVEGDTVFPELDARHWETEGILNMPADEKHAYAYSFERWKRKA